MSATITIQTHLLGDQRVGRIMNTKTLDANETIAEALRSGYVVGKPDAIRMAVKGVLKAMIDGISRDGDGRKIDAKFSIQPVANGRLDDICDDIDKSKLTVAAVARALKDLQLDTTGWTIILEGSTGSLRIDTISTGEETGVVKVLEDVAFNGTDLDSGTATVKWAVLGTTAAGTVAAAKVTADATRLTVTGDALTELNQATYNGKTIVFTVQIGNKKAVKAAVLQVG